MHTWTQQAHNIMAQSHETQTKRLFALHTLALRLKIAQKGVYNIVLGPKTLQI